MLADDEGKALYLAQNVGRRFRKEGITKHGTKFIIEGDEVGEASVVDVRPQESLI